MTETARTDSGAVTSDVVPGIGTAISAVTMAAVLVPVSQGTDDPALLAAVAFALVAVGAFLARRYDLGDRRTVAAVATVASVAVILCTGYVLNLGITASVDLPGLSSSLSLVMAAFVTAGLGVGVGVADARGIDAIGLKDRSSQMAILAVLGASGLLAAQFTTLFLAVPAIGVLGSLSELELVVVSQLGMALGTALVAVAYLSVTERSLSFIDLRFPTKGDVLWAVGGIFILFGALMAITLVFEFIGVESADHGTAQQAQENPEILLVLIPASLLVIGPFEELLYRNVIQKAMYETFSRVGAIVAGSVIFAVVHVLAYGTAGPGEVIASLAVIFGLSIVLGTLYERTDNLLVPAVVHGLYNAILFANLYALYG